MSLVNVFATSDKVVILTDTSIYDETGKIILFADKCFAVASWHGIYAYRGNTWGPFALADLVERYGSFNEFLARSAPEVEKRHRAALAEGILRGQTMIELHVAGWSEREDRARAYVLRSAGIDGDHLPPYVWTEVEGAWHRWFDMLALWRLARQGAEPDLDWGVETFDPHRHAIPLAEEQRRLIGEARRLAARRTGSHDRAEVAAGGAVAMRPALVPRGRAFRIPGGRPMRPRTRSSNPITL